jgi:DNA/RNA endonuclease YhcR with UshA esterase domain
MKKIFVLLGLTLMLFACKNEPKKENAENIEAPVIALADFNTKAGKWVGKEVAVEGIVDHVCKHGGKRLLLVDDNGDVHVDSETRFDDALTGSSITVKGKVTEFRVDEAYCLQQEENHIQKHKEGTDSDSVYAKKMDQLTYFRDSMKAAGTDHISYYSIEYVSHEIKE